MATAPVQVRLVNADAFTVNADEVLIVRLPQDTPGDLLEGMLEALELVGLKGRSLVLSFDGVELTKVVRGDGAQ